MLLLSSVFLFVFLSMLAIGPPQGWKCRNGKPHNFGDWDQTFAYHQWRACKVCGYRERRSV